MHSKFSKFFGITVISLACMLVMAPIQTWGETLDIRISQSSDDCQQNEAPTDCDRSGFDVGDEDEDGVIEPPDRQ